MVTAPEVAELGEAGAVLVDLESGAVARHRQGGRAVEGAVRALDEPGIGAGAVRVVEVVDLGEAGAVLVDLKDSTTAPRSGRAVRLPAGVGRAVEAPSAPLMSVA